MTYLPSLPPIRPEPCLNISQIARAVQSRLSIDSLTTTTRPISVQHLRRVRLQSLSAQLSKPPSSPSFGHLRLRYITPLKLYLTKTRRVTASSSRMTKTALQLQDHIARLESELELSKFLNKGVLQTNIEYKARIVDLEYENDVLRKAESRLASTEEQLEQAQARAEKLEERLIEEEGHTQAALGRESAALQRLTAAERSRGTLSFQDKLRQAEWEDTIRDLEDEKDDWRQKYEQLSALLTPVISALNQGKTIDLNPNRLRASTTGVVRTSGVSTPRTGHVPNGRSHQANGRASFASPHVGQQLSSRATNQKSVSCGIHHQGSRAQRHSSPIRQKRKTLSDDDDVFRPKSTPDRIIKSNSRLNGQQSAKRMRPQSGDDWSDVDVKSEVDSDVGELSRAILQG